MDVDLTARLRGAYARTNRFLSHDIWEQRLDELPRWRARGYRTARILYTSLGGLVFGDTLQVRAAALTYFSVLSLVPLLAFAFALLKGFGAYDLLVEETIRPQLMDLLSGNQALSTAFDQILGFVERTGVTSLGVLGLLTLLYAATRLLRNVEGSLNEIWDVVGGRTTLEQLRDYVSIIVITPLCLLGAAGLTTAGQALTLLRKAGETLGIGGLLDALISTLGPLAVLFVGLLVLYKVMPYTEVRMLSAAAGASVGALLWYAVLIAHVRFQVGVARYNALYSSFGAIPIFLAWLQLSWLTVLVGAQVAATHQNGRALARRKRTRDGSHARYEQLGLAAALRIADAFVKCTEPPTCSALADELDQPVDVLATLLQRLVECRIVASTERSGEAAYILARPAARIRVKDVLDALRQLRECIPQDTKNADVARLARELWDAMDRASASADANRSLSDVLDEPQSVRLRQE